MASAIRPRDILVLPTSGMQLVCGRTSYNPPATLPNQTMTLHRQDDGSLHSMTD